MGGFTHAAIKSFSGVTSFTHVRLAERNYGGRTGGEHTPQKAGLWRQGNCAQSAGRRPSVALHANDLSSIITARGLCTREPSGPHNQRCCTLGLCARPAIPCAADHAYRLCHPAAPLCHPRAPPPYASSGVRPSGPPSSPPMEPSPTPADAPRRSGRPKVSLAQASCNRWRLRQGTPRFRPR